MLKLEHVTFSSFYPPFFSFTARLTSSPSHLFAFKSENSMEESKKPKTPEEIARLKVERKERRTLKKLQARAVKRGVGADGLDQDTLREKLKQFDNSTIMANPAKKRKRGSNFDTKKTTVYVGNLSFRAGEPELRKLFSFIGDSSIIDISLPNDKESGKFYGIAFVQFDTVENAQKALERDGWKVLGRPVRVQLKSENSKKVKTLEAESGAPEKSPEVNEKTNVESDELSKLSENDGSTVFVAAIADDATDEEIMTLFSKYGRVQSFRRIHDKVTKEFTGAAFIQFINETSANNAKKALHKVVFHHRPLRVELAKQKTLK